MSHLAFTPLQFLYRVMRDYLKTHPDNLFMPTAIMSEQLKIPEEMLHPVLEQLHEQGLIDLHPMWPHVREAFISNAFAPPKVNY